MFNNISWVREYLTDLAWFVYREQNNTCKILILKSSLNRFFHEEKKKHAVIMVLNKVISGNNTIKTTL